RAFQLLNLRPQQLQFAWQIAFRRYGRGVLKIVGDASRNPRLLGKLVLLKSEPLIVLNAFCHVGLNSAKLLVHVTPPGFETRQSFLKTRSITPDRSQLRLQASQRRTYFGNSRNRDCKMALAKRACWRVGAVRRN